jgi:hypothetical protein
MQIVIIGMAIFGFTYLLLILRSLLSGRSPWPVHIHRIYTLYFGPRDDDNGSHPDEWPSVIGEIQEVNSTSDGKYDLSDEDRIQCMIMRERTRRMLP